MQTLNILDADFCLCVTITLAHFLWQGSVIGMALFAGTWCLRRGSANARHIAGVAALLLMLACLPVTFVLVRTAPRVPTENANGLAARSTVGPNGPLFELPRSESVAGADLVPPETGTTAVTRQGTVHAAPARSAAEAVRTLNAKCVKKTVGRHSELSSAKELALQAHAKAAAIDKLSRFYIRAYYGAQEKTVITDPSKGPLETLKRALDEPVVEKDWYRSDSTFAWDEKHFLIGDRELSPADRRHTKAPASVQGFAFCQWGRPDLAGERYEHADRPAYHVLRGSAAAMWKDVRLSYPNYVMATRHVFWWGINSHDNQYFSGSLVPPSRSEYRTLGVENFDGETCTLVESRTRMERLWISRKTGLIRGIVNLNTDGRRTDFYKSPQVRQITGRSFDTQRQYDNWYRTRFEHLPVEKQWALFKAGTDSIDWTTVRPGLLVRFRDFREVAPGIWWPYREDRAQGGFDNDVFSYFRCEYTVEEVRTDVDLAATVQALQPKEGEQVQDQRYAVPVNYDYHADRTEAEILKMVDTEYRKRVQDQALVDRLKEPIEKMVGHPAPALPQHGWVGGARPDLAGKPYLVHFWAIWCGPCKNDFPLLRQMAGQGARIVGMHPAGVSSEEVEEVLAESKLGYPTYLASKDDSRAGGRIIAGYPVGIFPYYILIDAHGNVVAHGSLHENNSELLARFRDLREAAGRLEAVITSSSSKPTRRISCG